MKLEEYSAYDGLGLAELIRNGEVSASEVAQAAIDAIEKLDPELNAVIESYPDRTATLDVGKLPGGALKGSPFLIKDLV
ncbi:MAG: amidase, partial [Proteobacteria bacterium]|nr:amidase [Pseudomonadota bacterium]